MIEGSLLMYFLGLGVLIFLSASFSAAETAIISLNKFKIRQLADDQVKNAITLNRLLKKPNRLLATILVGNNIVNIGASSLATAVALDLFGSQGVGIATGVVTLLVLVFGEITPKTLATQKAEQLALLIAGPLSLLSYLLYPVIKMLTLLTNILIRLFGGKVTVKGPFVTEEEIRALVKMGQKEGVIEVEEKEMIDSIFEFDDTLVREVMVPRIDVIAVPSDLEFDPLVDLIIEGGHSRIPVYDQSIDNIVGIVYAKDLLQLCKEQAPCKAGKIMRPAYFTPESKKINDLLQEFQQLKIHMAIVLDEYGGTAGIVTFEDLLEEIVGDIQDEYDREEKQIHMVDPELLAADARVSLDEINEILALELPDEEFDTLGGFFYSLVGKVPKEGETVEFDDCILTVLKVNGRRIKTIQVKKK